MLAFLVAGFLFFLGSSSALAFFSSLVAALLPFLPPPKMLIFSSVLPFLITSLASAADFLPASAALSSALWFASAALLFHQEESPFPHPLAFSAAALAKSLAWSTAVLSLFVGGGSVVVGGNVVGGNVVVGVDVDVDVPVVAVSGFLSPQRFFRSAFSFLRAAISAFSLSTTSSVFEAILFCRPCMRRSMAIRRLLTKPFGIELLASSADPLLAAFTSSFFFWKGPSNHRLRHRPCDVCVPASPDVRRFRAEAVAARANASAR